LEDRIHGWWRRVFYGGPVPGPWALAVMREALLSLFTSRVRLKILELMLPRPDEMYYVRQITRMVGEEVNAVRRELERLKKIGLLRTEKRGNRLYYQVRESFPLYSELLGMVGKITNLGGKIVEKVDRLGSVKYAVLSRDFVKGRQSGTKEVDLLVVGKVHLPELQQIIRESEEAHGHEINYTVLTEDELNFRKRRNDAFIRDVLLQPLIVLFGEETELKRWS